MQDCITVLFMYVFVGVNIADNVVAGIEFSDSVKCINIATNFAHTGFPIEHTDFIV
jgi:hypothetical protein